MKGSSLTKQIFLHLNLKSPRKMDQKKTVEEAKLGSETLDEARARWHREHLESKQRADKINKKFHEDTEKTRWNIHNIYWGFDTIALKVFKMFEQYAPVTTENDAYELVKTFVEKAKDIVCENACGGAWDCEHCPVFKDFDDLRKRIDANIIKI